MKKFLSFFAILAVFSIAANAQEQGSSSPSTTPGMDSVDSPKKAFARAKNAPVEEKAKMNEKMENRKEERKERWENASPEQKEKMRQHHEMMEKLTPEQKGAVKKEMERHRQEMKKITGFDMPMMHHHDKMSHEKMDEKNRDEKPTKSTKPLKSAN
jgi:hypothetical protein